MRELHQPPASTLDASLQELLQPLHQGASNLQALPDRPATWPRGHIIARLSRASPKNQFFFVRAASIRCR